MKKYTLFILITLFLLSFNNIVVNANEFNESIYDTFNNKISEFNKNTSSDINVNFLNNLNTNEIIHIIKNKFISDFKVSFEIIAKILFCVIIIMIIDTFISNKNISQIAVYGCYFVCSYIILDNFNSVYKLCLNTLNTIIELMNLTIPVYASSLIVSGYSNSANVIQSIFVIISSVMSNLILKILMPLLYYLGILSIVSSVISIIDVDKIIKLIFKTSKYIIGIMLTVFAGILSFSGINAITNDTIAFKTAKYAVANFVPVVGACLSESIGAITYSSIALKNKIGYIGFVILIIVSLVPILKIAFTSFVYKFSGATISMISKTKVTTSVELVGEVITTMLSMIIFATIIFLLIIGIIMGIGLL